jgi:hypothetical protein
MRAPLRRALTAVARGASASGMNLPSRRDHRGRARPPSADGRRKRHTAALIDRPTGPALIVIAALVPEGAPVLAANEIELVPGPGFPHHARGK